MRRDGSRSARIRSWQSNDTGSSIVEFALVLPLLLSILFGTMVYGIYMWRAHALQQVANDAARAAIAGETKAERRQMIDDTIASELQALGGLTASIVTAAVADTGTLVTVDLSYDATSDLANAAGFVPLPSPVIRRRAVVRLAGL